MDSAKNFRFVAPLGNVDYADIEGAVDLYERFVAPAEESLMSAICDEFGDAPSFVGIGLPATTLLSGRLRKIPGRFFVMREVVNGESICIVEAIVSVPRLHSASHPV